MALALTPRLLRRGLELFAVISLMGVVVVLVVFGENLQAFLSALAGPLAIYLGAGKSLAEHNVVLGITYYGLFRTSLTIFGVLGVLMLVAMVFPVWLRDAVHWLATRLERKSRRVAARIEQLREGIDRAHDCLVAFGSPKGWLALLWSVLLSGPSHANKLLAGYVALR